MADIKKAGSFKQWEDAADARIIGAFASLFDEDIVFSSEYQSGFDQIPELLGVLKAAEGKVVPADVAVILKEMYEHVQMLLALAAQSMVMTGLDTTSEAEAEGFAEGQRDANEILLIQLREELEGFIVGRMRQLGMNRTGSFLSKGSNKKYLRYGRLPRYLQLSGAKVLNNKVPYVSAFMNMGTRNTNDKTKAGAPHSPFVEYGFKDKAGRKHAPRPIFKLAKANMPAMLALATAKAEQKVIRTVSNSVNSRLTPAKSYY